MDKIMQPANPKPGIPTIEQLRNNLDALLSMCLMNFHKMGVDGLTINTLGACMSKLDFSKQPTKEEYGKMLDEAATKQLENITLLLLRSSITN